MSNRLTKQGVLAMIIYFLMITAVSTPIAFYTGKARGAERARIGATAVGDLSQNETGAAEPSLPVSLALAPQTNTPPAIGPAGNGAAGLRFSPRAPSVKPAALREAVMQAIAGGPSEGSTGSTEDAGPPPSPLSLAMAPDLSSGLLGGTANGPVGFPGAIIPGFLAGPSAPPPQGPGPNTPGPDNPGGETPGGPPPPVVVTPVPAALPLMITGLAGLFAVRRRARA